MNTRNKPPKESTAQRRKRIEAEATSRDPIDWSAQPLGLQPDGEIARRLGVSQPAVSAARRRRRIPAWSGRPGPKVDPGRDAAVVASREEGMSLAAIGREHGISRERVRKIIERERISAFKALPISETP